MALYKNTYIILIISLEILGIIFFSNIITNKNKFENHFNTIFLAASYISKITNNITLSSLKSPKSSTQLDFLMCPNQGTGPTQDYDCDGITNENDIDDDNDGITDEEECGCSTQPFVNGSFEDLGTNTDQTMLFFHENTIPRWEIESNVNGIPSDNQIEIWYNGFQAAHNAANGNKFAEINGNQSAILFQEFCLNGNAGTINWSVKHKGRSNFVGNDTAEMKISTSLNSLTPLVSVTMVADTNLNIWTTYSNTFNIPAGITTLFISFESINTGSGNSTVGNFIDDIEISFNIPCDDIDGDGIENKFDLDSDGDGCPDSIEGSGSFNSSHLQTDNSLNGGNSGPNYIGNSPNSIQNNLGTNSTTEGLPNVLTSGQSIGLSQTAGAFLVISSPPSDIEMCENNILNPVILSSVLNSTPNSATINYNWLVSSDNGLTFSPNISNANGPTSGTTSSGQTVTLSLTNVNSTFNNNIYKIIYTTPNNSCPVEAEAKLTIPPSPAIPNLTPTYASYLC